MSPYKAQQKAATFIGDPENEGFSRRVQVFKALAEPVRLRIISLLADNPDGLNIFEITEAIGLSQPTVSHHINKLKVAGLVDAVKEGVFARVTLDPEAFAALVDGGVLVKDVPKRA